MEIAYLIAGKRFKARDDTDLNQQLTQYNLVSNLNTGDWSVRRQTDPQKTHRYLMTQAAGDSADSDEYDVIVGRTVGENGYGNQSVIIEKELSDLEIALNEVREDIPDAKIIAGSYWS